MRHGSRKRGAVLGMICAGLLLLWGVGAEAKVIGQDMTGNSTPSIALVAKQDRITLGDGDSMVMWGYGVDGFRMQYPGPTLIVDKGATVTVTLKNALPASAGNVSIVFPGHQVAASGGVPGLLTNEAPPDGVTVVTYTFTASHPGTYLYHSGTRPDLQVEMGLFGAIIVRSAAAATSGCWDLGPGFAAGPGGAPYDACLDTKYAYDHANTGYQREFLIVMSDMDPKLHRQIEFNEIAQVDTTKAFQTVWFINGRNFPDTIAGDNLPWLPTQPYGSLVLLHPGETVLVRMLVMGRDPHPLHFHGNHVRVIARDGRLLSSGPGSGPDLSYEDYTTVVNPGQTVDALFTWTGANMGWDVYGHDPGTSAEPYEFIGDHEQIFPVILPARDDVAFGQVYGGSPFLGGAGSLPPEHQGLNPGGFFFFMWHSHTEKELSNNNIFPGGLITLMAVAPWSAPLGAE